MARRKVGELPPKEIQALVPHLGYRMLPPDDGHLNEVALLAAVLSRYEAASRLVPHKPGRPTEWGRLAAAARWLEREGFDKVSDAPGSRCVKSLMRFLDGWREQERKRGVRRGRANHNTAAQLAGTLKAITERTEWK